MEDSALFLQRLAARWAPEQPTLLAPLTANDTYIPSIPAALLLNALLAAHGEDVGEAIASTSHGPSVAARALQSPAAAAAAPAPAPALAPAPAACDRASRDGGTAQRARGPWCWTWWPALVGSDGARQRWPLLCGMLALLLLLAVAGLCLLFLHTRLRRVPDSGAHVTSGPQPEGDFPSVAASDYDYVSASEQIPQVSVAENVGTEVRGPSAAEVVSPAARRLVSPRSAHIRAQRRL
jgi:hypothetical protein